MSSPLRIATFNAQNLFDRAAIFDIKDGVENQKLLNDLAELQRQLEQEAYNKQKIFSLFKSLEEYIEIAEDRGSLFERDRNSGAIVGVRANGVNSWDGRIVFKRAKFSEETRFNTARVINEIAADVQCLVEIENRLTLKEFSEEFLDSRFEYSMAIDGNDKRGIDVGLLSRFPIGNIRTHIFDKDSRGELLFDRDCLEVEVLLPADRKLTILCNHFKSKRNDSASRRQEQANRVSEIVSNFDLSQDLVVVAGDLNDTPTSSTIEKLLNTENLYDVLEIWFADMADRWTYAFRNQLDQIDYLLVSQPLREALTKAGVERRGMFNLSRLTNGREQSFPTVKDRSTAASDHAAVWAEFDLDML
ncbi:endonuclease/exonuclease/phosphatase family protein [Tolypothrix campylonemoides VB511288]|nr:endonuclease/exonuclease/phosphatase family protein [Tolypothrix campylonemoides VB511288]